MALRHSPCHYSHLTCFPGRGAQGRSGAAGGISVRIPWTTFVFYNCSNWLGTSNSLSLAICFLTPVCDVFYPMPWSVTYRQREQYTFFWMVSSFCAQLVKAAAVVSLLLLPPASPSLPFSCSGDLPASCKEKEKNKAWIYRIFDQTSILAVKN